MMNGSVDMKKKRILLEIVQHSDYQKGLACELQNSGLKTYDNIEDHYLSHVATCSPSGNVTLTKSGF